MTSCGKKETQENMQPTDVKVTEEQKEKVEEFIGSYTEEKIQEAISKSDYISEEFELNVTEELNVTLENGEYKQSKVKYINGQGISDPLDYFTLVMKYHSMGGIMDCAISIDVDADELESAKQEVLNVLGNYTNDNIKSIVTELLNSDENTKTVTSDSGDIKVDISLVNRVANRGVDVTDEVMDKAVEDYYNAIKAAGSAEGIELEDFITLAEEVERSILTIGVEFLEFVGKNNIDFLTVEGGMLDIVNNCPIFYSHSSDILNKVSYNTLASVVGLSDVKVNYIGYTEANGFGSLTVNANGYYQDNTSTTIGVNATDDNYTVSITSNYGDKSYIKQYISDIATKLYNCTAEEISNSLTEIDSISVDAADPIEGYRVDISKNIAAYIKNLDGYGWYVSLTLSE